MFDKPSHKRKAPKLYIRGKFTDETKQKVITRSNGICEYCKVKAGFDFHHVRKKSQAGRRVYTNCILVCRECHDRIHKHADIDKDLQQKFEQKYGKNYYKDEWDLLAD